MLILFRPNNSFSMSQAKDSTAFGYTIYLELCEFLHKVTSRTMVTKIAGHMRMLILSMDKYGYQREN
jgi:hypothetical protein